MTTAQWRPMRPEHTDDLIAIAAEVHPGYPEDDDVLKGRMELYPEGCLVLSDGDRVTGYLLSHPWVHGNPPALNVRIPALPEQADTYYIHDLSLLPAAQGTGAARRAVETAIAHARTEGYARMSLCAVNGSGPFWARHGFAETPVPGLDSKLQSYGDDVRFMARAL